MRWADTLSAQPHSIASDERDEIDVLLYADAAYAADSDTVGLGEIVIDRRRFINTPHQVDTIYESIPSRSPIDLFRRSSIVSGSKWPLSVGWCFRRESGPWAKHIGVYR